MKYYNDKIFVKERLTFWDRYFVFRRQIKYISGLFTFDDEYAIDILVGTIEIPNVLSDYYLFVLTTHKLIMFEPFKSTQVHHWNGMSQIDSWVIFDPNNRTITFNIYSEPNNEESSKEFVIKYRKIDELNARRFHAMALGISLYWGQPEKFEESIKKTIDKLERY